MLKTLFLDHNGKYEMLYDKTDGQANRQATGLTMLISKRMANPKN